MQPFAIEWPGLGWWAAALAAGLLLAGLALWERQPWSRPFRTYLAASRFALGVLLVLTLARPLLHRYTRYELRPVVGIGIDDSRSVGRFLGQGGADTLRTRLVRLRQGLEAGGYRVAFTTLAGDTTADSLRLQAPRTDLQTLGYLAREPRGEGTLAATVLVTDGLFNEGTNPTLTPARLPVYTLGIGDTVRRPDARIAALRVNKLVAAGANYTARVEVQAQGLPTQRLSLVIEQDGQAVGTRLLTLGGSARRARVDFTLPAGLPGTRSLRVRLQPARGEQNLANNTATAYVEVARLAKRVLLAAAAPHPDLKAIRAALEPLEQLEVVLYIPGQTPEPQGRYDVAVLHGLPQQGRALPSVLAELTGRQPTWYILTGQTDLAAFSAQNPVLKVQGTGGQDEVQASFNPGFGRFVTDAVRPEVLRRLPPLSAPFGNYNAAPGAQVLLGQRLGQTDNGKPLWLFGAGSGKAAGAVLAAEGIWQWRLQEAFADGTPTVTDFLIARTVQLLAAQAERKRFRLQPLTPVADLGNPVGFEAYLEDRTGQPARPGAITLAVAGPGNLRKTYTLQTSDGTSGLELADLPAGTYTYRATTRLAGEALQDQGRFAIQATDLEDIDAGADFAMLRRLAQTTGGQFATLGQEQGLVQALVAKRPPATLRTHQTSELLIKQWWWLALIVALFVAEVAARKFKGGQ